MDMVTTDGNITDDAAYSVLAVPLLELRKGVLQGVHQAAVFIARPLLRKPCSCMQEMPQHSQPAMTNGASRFGTYTSHFTSR